MQVALQLPELESGVRLCVAVSGGADSMALACLVQDYVRSHGGEVHAVHVDHRLRAESAQEANLTKTRLEALGIACDIVCWHHEGIATAIQEKARNARYALLTQWCRAHQCTHVLTAHHADDQAETIAFRLWRGAGVEGLAGIKPVRSVDGIQVIRPLLHLSKTQLIGFLQERGIAWVEDASNQNSAFDRIKIRRMLAANPELTPRLLALGEHMARASDAIEARVQCFLNTHAEQDEHETRIHADALMALPFEFRIRVISQVIARMSRAPEPPRYYQLKRIAENLPKKASLGGVTLIHEGQWWRALAPREKPV